MWAAKLHLVLGRFPGRLGQRMGTEPRAWILSNCILFNGRPLWPIAFYPARLSRADRRPDFPSQLTR